MIQIEDWLIVAIVMAFFLAGICYLIYFKIKSKLFPMVREFQGEVNPNEAKALLEIVGSGIIKKIEMQVRENNNSLIYFNIDKTGYTNFRFTREQNKMGKESRLKIEVNLDTKFRKDFSLFIHNRDDISLNSTGKIFYEIKKPLIVVLKSIYSELTS